MQSDPAKPPSGLGKVILAASAGTLIEWYDFYIFGSLAKILSTHFFPGLSSTTALVMTLATFATGFLARPFGAVVFGRMGDMLGRKHTFLLTLLMMGFSTAAIGIIPDYHVIGMGAPILLVLLRLTQGLALGGQYGGAALYIAEHAPVARRGFFTSFLQTTATLGLLVSLMIILGLKGKMGETEFAAWGWRIPFLLSSILVIFSYLIRRRMAESPAFAALQAEGGVSKNPLVESFVNPVNRRRVLLALFGLVAGQGVVWYTAQFYVSLFMKETMHLNAVTADQIVAWGLVLGTPFYILLGALSDRIGRKRIVMAGLALAILAFVPIYGKMQALATVNQFDRVGKMSHKFVTDPKTGAPSKFRVTSVTDSAGVTETQTVREYAKPPPPGTKREAPKVEVFVSAGIFWALVGLVFVQVLFAALAYGPIAAFLVEMFPVQIRYTSMSVPYHIGNGVFGGLVPVIGVALVATTGNNLAGLLYPIGIALMTLIVGCLCIRERRVPGGGFEEAA